MDTGNHQKTWRKTALQNHKLWSDNFFRRMMVQVRRRNSDGKKVPHTAKQMACASICEVSGAASPLCNVTGVIRNVHDRPDSVRTRPAIVTLLHPVDFKSIPQPWTLDAWHQWRNTARVVAPPTPESFWPFGRLLDCIPVQTLTSDLHHQTLRKKAYKIWDYDLDCSCPLVVDDRNEWSDYLPTIPSGRRHPAKYLHTVHWCLSASAMLPTPPPLPLKAPSTVSDLGNDLDVDECTSIGHLTFGTRQLLHLYLCLAMRSWRAQEDVRLWTLFVSTDFKVSNTTKELYPKIAI